MSHKYSSLSRINIFKKIRFSILKSAFSNNSIKYRLIRTFSIFIILTIATSILSIYVTKDTSNTLQEMSNIYNQQIALAANLSTTNKNIMINLQNFVYNPSLQYLQDTYIYIAQLKTLQAKTSQVDSDSASKSIRSSISSLCQKLETSTDLIVNNINNKNISSATNLLQNTLSGTFSDLDKSINQYITLKENTLTQLSTREISRQQITVIILVVGNGLGIILGVIFLFVLSQKITSPIRLLANKSKNVSEGDLTIIVDVKSNDEVGMLANSFSDMVQTLRNILTNLNENAGELLTLSKNIDQNTSQSAETAAQISIAIQSTLDGSKKQVATIADATKLVEKMLDGIYQISKSTFEARNISIKSEQLAMLGSEKMLEVSQHMTEINNIIEESSNIATELEKKSANVSSVTKIISEITTQTKLLSLNAALEAAKAGEMGKTFTVIANEVRKLAQKSKEATSDIDNIIMEMKDQVSKTTYITKKGAQKTKIGIDVVRSANEAFDQIFDSSKNSISKIEVVHECVENMVNDSQQISTSFNDILTVASASSESMQQVSKAMNQQTDSITKISKSTTILTQLSTQLFSLLAKFKIK